MHVFDFSEYKQLVLGWIKAQPSGGRGQQRLMAEALRSSSVVMSQVFHGSRDLTPEQALGVARFMGLSELESDYFLLLVQRARSGSQDLTALLDRQLKKLRQQSQKIRARIEYAPFSDEARAMFYSSWAYSAVRLGLAVPGTSPQYLASRLDLDKSFVAEIVEFLLRHGLLKKTKAGYELGPAGTHVSADEPLVERHHVNWRLKAMEKVRFTRPENPTDLHYTGPMVISEKLAEEFRAELLQWLERAHQKIKAAPNERVHCLTIDWFLLTP